MSPIMGIFIVVIIGMVFVAAVVITVSLGSDDD